LQFVCVGTRWARIASFSPDARDDGLPPVRAAFLARAFAIRYRRRRVAPPAILAAEAAETRLTASGIFRPAWRADGSERRRSRGSGSIDARRIGAYIHPRI